MDFNVTNQCANREWSWGQVALSWTRKMSTMSPLRESLFNKRWILNMPNINFSPLEIKQQINRKS